MSRPILEWRIRPREDEFYRVYLLESDKNWTQYDGYKEHRLRDTLVVEMVVAYYDRFPDWQMEYRHD